MRVTVLLFASYADALGERTLAVDLPEGARVGELIADLRTRPGAEAVPPAPLVAVNERYASVGTSLQQGDVVAVLPPVAGG